MTTFPEQRILAIAEHIRSYSAAEGRLAVEVARPSERSQGPTPWTPTPPLPAPLSAFEEMISAVAFHKTAPAQLLAPPSRYMVRVAPVGKPHRATKRKYDYFETLNVLLAAEEPDRGPTAS